MLDHIVFGAVRLIRDIVDAVSNTIDDKNSSSCDKEEWIVVSLGLDTKELDSL